MIVKKIQKGKHLKKCCALFHVNEGTWNSPWACPEVAWLDKNANNTGRTTTWIAFMCNDPSCNAKLYVLEDDLLRAIGESN